MARTNTSTTASTSEQTHHLEPSRDMGQTLQKATRPVGTQPSIEKATLQNEPPGLEPSSHFRTQTFDLHRNSTSNMGIQTESSSRSSQRTSVRARRPPSSKHTSLSRLSRAALATRLRSGNSSTYTDAPETPSSSSYRRRESSTDFWLALSNEDGQTVTTVRHDPADAEARAQRRKLERPDVLQQTHSFRITPESEREEEDSMTVADQARKRREEAEDLRRRGKFGIEQTQSFHVSYDAMPANRGCCGTHVGSDGSRDRARIEMVE